VTITPSVYELSAHFGQHATGKIQEEEMRAYVGQQRISSVAELTRSVCTAEYAAGHTNVGPSTYTVLLSVGGFHHTVASGGRHGI
jgi:hypothetical protein